MIIYTQPNKASNLVTHDEDPTSKSPSVDDSSALTSPSAENPPSRDGGDAEGADPFVPAEETPAYGFFSETLLENTEFQNLLAENINSCVATTSNLGNNQDLNMTLQQQLDHTTQNILMTMEKNPIFDQIVQEAINGAPEYKPDGLSKEAILPTSTPHKSSGAEYEVQPLPTVEEFKPTMRERLRPRKTTNEKPSYMNESPKRAYKKRKDKLVEVISNEPFTGTLPGSILTQENGPTLYLIKADGGEGGQSIISSTPNVSQPMTSTMYFNGVPFIFTTNTTANSDDRQNASLVSDQLNMPFYFQPQLNLTTTSNLNPGTIINTADLGSPSPIVFHEVVDKASDAGLAAVVAEPPIESIIVIEDDESAEIINPSEEVKDAQAPKSADTKVRKSARAVAGKMPVAATPKQPVNQSIQASSKCMSTPRHKISHVRVLDFNTPVRMKCAEAARNREIACSGRFSHRK